MKDYIIKKYLECEKELKTNINLSIEDVMFIKGKMAAFMTLLNEHKLWQTLNDFKLENHLKKENNYLDKILKLQTELNLYKKEFPNFIITDEQIKNEIKKCMLEVLNND